MELQLRVLETYPQKKTHQIGNITLTREDLRRTLEILLSNRDQPVVAAELLDAHQSWGADRKGHVRFTGYYTPVLKVKKSPDETYRYPFYRRPKNWPGPLPSRREIEAGGVLRDQELEIAYASDPLDIYLTQLQGSCLVEFVDTGERRRFVFDGANGKPFTALETLLRKRPDLPLTSYSIGSMRKFFRQHPAYIDSILWENAAYTFFSLDRGEVLGAAQTPLTPFVSVAADKKYFPLGSVLLACLPVIDRYGEISHFEFRILLPQDVGGAIQGPGRLDLYCGPGSAGQSEAGKRSHYGRVWLLLPADHQNAN